MLLNTFQNKLLCVLFGPQWMKPALSRFGSMQSDLLTKSTYPLISSDLNIKMMPLSLTRAEDGSKIQSYFVQVHLEALNSSTSSGQLSEVPPGAVLAPLQFHERQIDQTLVNHWLDKDVKRTKVQKNLFRADSVKIHFITLTQCVSCLKIWFKFSPG